MKKVVSLLLTVVMLFSLAPAAFATGGGTELRESTPELEELIRAVELGFGTNVDDVSDMTYAQYCAMLETLAGKVTCSGAKTFEQWKTQYLTACGSTETIDRLHAIYMLYTLAYDVLGGGYAALTSYRPNGQTWSELHTLMGNGVFDLVWPASGQSAFNGTYFSDYGNTFEPFTGANTRFAAAYLFSFGKTSVSGWPLFEYDKTSNSMRVTANLTMREAMLSCLRLYESVEQFDMAVGQTYNQYNASTGWTNSTDVLSYRTDIITLALLERAQYMPTPTMSNLPYYTGVHLSWLPSDSEPTEAAFRHYAELGMNYVRVDLSCRNFFGMDIASVADIGSLNTAVTQVDMACLTKLDEMISWGLKYGLHVSVQFSDHPGHIQFLNLTGSSTADTDFYTNETKQQQTAAIWALIADRYQGIPNGVLSFIINHEPLNPGRSTGVAATNPTDAQVMAANTLVAEAIREKDATRFLFCQGGYDQCIDPYMTDSQLGSGKELGLAQVTNYAANEFAYWNMITDASFSGGYYPDWPYYAIHSRLVYFSNSSDPLYYTHNPSLTIDGFLPEGTVFSIKMRSDAALHISAVNSEGGAVTLTSATLDATGTGTSDTRTFTLPAGVASLTLALTDNGCVDFEQFLITLPGTDYKRDHYYTNGSATSTLNDAVIDFKLTRNNDNVFNHLSDTAKALRAERCWVLNESATADLTITYDETNDIGYTSKYGYNKDTLAKMAELYDKQRDDYGVAGMNFEFVAVGDLTETAVNDYFDDLLTAFKTNNIGWALYFAHTLYSDYYNGAEQTPTHGSGLMVNSELIDVLKAHAGTRPTIMAEVPAASGINADWSAIGTIGTAQIVYGKTNADIITGEDSDTMSCGSGLSLTGSYAVTDASTVQDAGSRTITVTFTASNAVDNGVYKGVVLRKEYTVEIGMSDPTCAAPTGLTATYGDTLDDVAIASGNGTGTGTWSWDADKNMTTTTVGAPGSNTFKAKFTPTDTNNYNILSDISVDVTVSAADYTVSVDGTQNIKQGSGLAAITVDDKIAGVGVGGASVAGTLTWYSNEGCTADAADTDLNALAVNATKTLYWSFTTANANYTSTAKTGSTEFTVAAGDPQTLTFATPNSMTKTYGDTGFTNAATNSVSSGGAITYASSVETVATVNTSTGAVRIIGAGQTTITVTAAAVPGQYAQGTASYTLTVNPKAATVRLRDFSVTVNGAAPTPTLVWSGLVGGETLGIAVDPAFTVTKSDNTPIAITDAVKAAGTYTITWTNMGTPVFTDGTGEAANYTVTPTAVGTLTVNPDGGGGGGITPSVTVPASSDEGSVEVSATVSGDTANITVTDTQLNTIISDKEATGTVKVDVSSLKVDEAVIPAKLVTAAAEAKDGEGLEVEFSTGSVTLDVAALNNIGDKSVTVSVETVKPDELTEAQKKTLGDKADTAIVLDVNVLVNNVKTSGFGGGVITVSVPYAPKAGEDTSKLVVWYLADDGSIEPMNGKFNAVTKCYEFTTTHLSTYVLTTFTFADVAADSYYYSAVAWAVASGTTEGTSATTFSPENTCTRAQMVTFLWRALGSPEPESTTCQFTDVDANAYYYKAVLWAAGKGYTEGTSATTFSPNDTVTRAQMVTFEWRTAGKPAASAANPFKDVSSGAYYEDAVLWAIAQKITEGTSATTFSPTDPCTRAQIVTFLYRYLVR